MTEHPDTGPPEQAKKDGVVKKSRKLVYAVVLSVGWPVMIGKRAYRREQLKNWLDRYITIEVITAWNLSSWITVGQVVAVQNWKIISSSVASFFSTKVVPFARTAKETALDVRDVLFHLN